MKSFIVTIEDAIYVAGKMLEYSDDVEMTSREETRLNKINERSSRFTDEENLRFCQKKFDHYFSVNERCDLRRSIVDLNRKHRQTRDSVKSKSKQKVTKQIRVSLGVYNGLKKIMKKEGLDSFNEAIRYLRSESK